MKKILVLMLSIVSVGLLFFMWNLEERYYIGVEVKSSHELDRIIRDKKEVVVSPEEIWNNQHKAFYDAPTNTIFVSQAVGDDEKEQMDGTLETKEGVLYLLEDEMLHDPQKAIRESKRFSLYHVVEDTYCRYDLLFTGVPVMNIQVEDTYEDWIASTNKIVSVSTIEVVDPYRPETAYQKIKGEFYRRGKTSYFNDYCKKNYRLTLTEDKVSLLGMRKDDDWILNGLLDDGGMVHHKACYTLWNQLASRNGDTKVASANVEYLDLFIDHQYMGTYGLTERIDKKQLQLSENDKLYKIRSVRDMEDHNFTNEDTDGRRPIAITKYPDNPTDEDWNPLRFYNDCFVRGWIGDINDAYALLDYQNAIDYNLFIQLIFGEDNYIDNSYLIADYQSDSDSYQLKRIPWDLNLTFGSLLTDTPETNWIYWDESTVTNTSKWTKEMITLYTRDEKKVAKDMYDRWVELRQDIYSPQNLYQIFDGLYDYLYSTGAYVHNYQWFPYDTSSWDDNYVYEFIDRRLTFLDKYFERLYLASIGEPVYIYDGVDYTSEFNYWYYYTTNLEYLWDEFEDNADEAALLEHYVLVGKPNGLQGKKSR